MTPRPTDPLHSHLHSHSNFARPEEPTRAAAYIATKVAALLTVESEPARRWIAETLVGELDAMDSHASVRLDRQLREVPIAVSPDDVGEFLSLGPHAVAPLCVLASGRSGYLREAAVRQLVAFRTPLAHRLLLFRASDFVPEVRELALTELSARLVPECRALWLRATDLFGTLFGRKRLLGAFGYAELDRLFASDDAARELESAALATFSGTIFVCRLRFGYGDASSMLRVAQHVLDTRIPQRLAFVARLVLRSKVLGLEEKRALILPLLHNRSHALRVLALKTFGASVLPTEDLERHAVDRQASVRFEARRILAARGAFHSRAFYRQVLQRPILSRDACLGALDGIADSGSAADLDVVTPFLADARPSVAKEARRAIGMLTA